MLPITEWLIKVVKAMYYAAQVNMIKGDGSVIHFNNPKVQASLSANTFAVTGHAETKRLFYNSLYA